MISIEVQLRGAVELRRGLERVERTIRTRSSVAVGAALAQHGLRIVRRLTPRRKFRGYIDPGRPPRGEPFKKQWDVLEDAIGSEHYRARIFNWATMTQEGVEALAAVEFGAKPHQIRPRRATSLAWIAPGKQRLFEHRTGLANALPGSAASHDVTETYSTRSNTPGAVYSRHVRHPGHAGFHMIEETRQQLERLSVQMLQRFAVEIQREFGPIFVSVR